MARRATPYVTDHAVIIIIACNAYLNDGPTEFYASWKMLNVGSDFALR